MVVSPAEVQQALEFFAKAENPAALFQRVIKLCPGFTFRPPEQGDLPLLGDFQYLKLISGSMEFAISPHARSPPLASLVGITTRPSAWKWVVEQIRSHVPDRKWIHAQSLGRLAQIFGQMFFAMGRCKFPLYFNESLAGEWFDLWRIVNETRMLRNS